MRGGKWGEMGHMHTSTLHPTRVQVRAGVPTIGRDTTRTPTCTGAARDLHGVLHGTCTLLCSPCANRS
jgi:hypothetical protein